MMLPNQASNRIAAALAAMMAVTAPPASARTATLQIRTVDIPPSAPEGWPGLQLDLPSIEEAREADAATRAEPPLPTGEDAAAAKAAEVRAAAEREAARLREANTRQLEAAREQSRQIAADRQAQQERMAQYDVQRQAHDAALSAYTAQVAAAEKARRAWEADVAACRSGDWSRCGAPAPVQ